MSNKLPSYLHITDQASSKLNELINRLNPDKVGLLVDENTKKYCLPKLNNPYDLLIEIKSGEQEKNLETCDQIWKDLTVSSFTRKSLLVNLGGGVIGDMGGFAASTFKRGIPFVNVPTTLLSQVDASIGGKLGVDYNGLKNHIGVFRDPDAVIVDSSFLETLPQKHVISGYAEVAKHALIHDDKHWSHLDAQDLDSLDWKEIIPKSIAIKQQVVSEDPFEKGLRKILNFGHTLGHAIESHLLHSATPLLHGEAIAIGMILESHISTAQGMTSTKDYESIKNHLMVRFNLPTELPAYETLAPYLIQDKKNINENVSFSLLKRIGECAFDQSASTEQIQNSLEAYAR